MTLTKGRTYAAEDLKLAGWTPGDGTGAEGYNVADYFREGVYLGADSHGIEPEFEGPRNVIARWSAEDWDADTMTASKYTYEDADTREPGDVELLEAAGVPEGEATVVGPQCKGGHKAESGKTVNAKGWCNLCLTDMRRGKAAGTTARERGLL